MRLTLKQVLALLLAISVSACKVQITVPEGGRVASASGARDCEAGDTCSFEVVDLFFEDTFLGEAGEGFAFAGWQRGNNSLCGGSAKDCFLSTGGFSGNPALLAVLESDETFFLRPLFVEKLGSGKLINRPMTACIDPDMYRSGYRSDISVQLYSNGVETGSRQTLSRVSGPVQYKGQSVMRLEETISNQGALDSEMTVQSYHLVDLARSSITTIGIDQASTSPVAQEVKGSISPGFLQRFDLKVGDSYTTSYTMDLTFPDGSSPDISRNISTEFIYEGMETIDIPAGRFQACRVHRFDNIDGDVSESYNWIGRNSGVLLLETDAAFVAEAAVLSGTVNGSAL